jgi:hypothetical protein
MTLNKNDPRQVVTEFYIGILYIGKTFFHETTSLKAYIFSMYYCIVPLHQYCPNNCTLLSKVPLPGKGKLDQSISQRLTFEKNVTRQNDNRFLMC